MKKYALTQWRGNLKQGMGFITSESGGLKNIPYSFHKRFGDEPGTNPEELIGAAYSACFAMAMSAELEKKNLRAECIDVKASVSLENTQEGWTIPKVHLTVSASVPKSEISDVKHAAELAKTTCPVSRLLNAEVTMDFCQSDHHSVEIHLQ